MNPKRQLAPPMTLGTFRIFVVLALAVLGMTAGARSETSDRIGKWFR
jgi:uncharacterized membrane protein